MKKTFSAVTGIMLALMMLFVSCEQGGMSKAQIDSRDLVSVSFTKVEAKSVNVDSIGEVTTPALNTLYFQYKAVKTAGEGAENVQGQKTEWTNLGSQGLAQTIQLSRGNWTISLRGFATDALRTAAGTSETASTQAVFEGTLNQDIGSNLTSRNENVNVSLDFTNPSGTGSYSLGVTIPASYASQQAKVKVTVTPASGEAQVQTYQFASGMVSHTYEFSTVNNGIASVKVEYLDAANVAIGDAVTANTLIMTDMTTNGSATIAEDNTFTVSFAGTSVNGSAESSTANISLSGNAFISKSSSDVESAIFPVSGYSASQVKVYYSTDLNATKDTILSGDSVTATLDVDTGSYVAGTNEETKSPFTGGYDSPVAVIASNSYGSLQNALNAAAEGNIITLLKDVSLSEYALFDKDFSISVDGNGHTLNSGEKIAVTGTGSISVTNMDNGYNNGVDGCYQKAAIVITSIDGTVKSDIMYATCFNYGSN